MAARELFAAAKLWQQTQNFKIQPDECDHQAERAVPLHVFRRTDADARFDEIKIEHKIERRDDHDKKSKADSDHTRTVDGRETDTEKYEYDFNYVEKPDTTRRSYDADIDFLSDSN